MFIPKFLAVRGNNRTPLQLCLTPPPPSIRDFTVKRLLQKFQMLLDDDNRNRD